MSVAMAAGERIEGKCLCGTVSFAATTLAPEMGACHCGQCRRWSSGVFFYVSVEPRSLVVRGEANLGLYRSSSFAERGFCRDCGSSLFWRTLDGREADVSAQALDEPARFPFAVEVHLDDKPSNYAFAGQRRRHPAGASAPERPVEAGEARNG